MPVLSPLRLDVRRKSVVSSVMEPRERVNALRQRVNGCLFFTSPARKVEQLSVALAMCSVPASIALTEAFLIYPLVLRLAALYRRGAKLNMPRIFWFWLCWAALEFVSWLHSPELGHGWGEMRHLLLIGALFLLMPVMNSASVNAFVWRGIVIVATLSSAVLISQFVLHLSRHRVGLDQVVYLRGGGLLHHWMIYGTVETLVFAGLLELLHFFRPERWWLLPVAAIHIAAIVLSLTRTLWVCCLLVLACHFLWTRSRWSWAIPAIPCLLFLLAPSAVRTRITDSVRPDYYANAERLQMLRVGFRMVRKKPFTGVGPGRVEELYTKYLSASDPVPAYHGHLHNNMVELAAEFGLPALAAALVFVAVLVHDLLRRCAAARNRNQQFLCRTSLLGLAGFVTAGMFDYTYGHSLGIILLAFTVLVPFASSEGSGSDPDAHLQNEMLAQCS